MQVVIALAVWTLSMFLPTSQPAPEVIWIQPTPVAAASSNVDNAIHRDAFVEAWIEFTTLFEATEVKWSKNGRLMVKGANANTFKFVKRSN